MSHFDWKLRRPALLLQRGRKVKINHLNNLSVRSIFCCEKTTSHSWLPGLGLQQTSPGLLRSRAAQLIAGFAAWGGWTGPPAWLRLAQSLLSADPAGRGDEVWRGGKVSGPLLFPKDRACWWSRWVCGRPCTWLAGMCHGAGGRAPWQLRVTSHYPSPCLCPCALPPSDQRR